MILIDEYKTEGAERDRENGDLGGTHDDKAHILCCKRHQQKATQVQSWAMVNGKSN